MNNVYDIWFARVQVANSVKLKLFKKFSTEEIFYFDEDKFLEQGIKEVAIKKFLNKYYRQGLDKYQEYLKANGIFQIFYKDERYPKRMKNISDFPTYIFVKRKYAINV